MGIVARCVELIHMELICHNHTNPAFIQHGTLQTHIEQTRTTAGRVKGGRTATFELIVNEIRQRAACDDYIFTLCVVPNTKRFMMVLSAPVPTTASLSTTDTRPLIPLEK